MFRLRRSLTAAAAAACSAALFLTACGGSNSDSGTPGGSSVEAGDPVAGGTLRVIQITEPRSLDPAKLSNTWIHQNLSLIHI